MSAGDIVRGELHSFARLLWAVELSLLIMGGLWLAISVLRYYSMPGGGAARWTDISEPAVAHSALLESGGQHTSSAAVLVLAEKHPMLASILNDIANPCLAHLILLLLTPLLVVVIWHWDDLLMRRPH